MTQQRTQAGATGGSGGTGASGGWAEGGASSLDGIARELRAARRVVLLTHVKPDGDAVGSTLAVARALLALPNPPSVMAWYFGPLPAWLQDIAGDTPVTLRENAPANANAMEQEHADAVLVCDTMSWTQVEPAAAFLRRYHAATNVIDHHVQGNHDLAKRWHVQTSAAAACEIAAELCVKLLNLGGPEELPAPVAEAAYLGLATDTGWFRHSNVTPGVMALAGKLLQAGADNVKLYREVEQRETPGRLRLIARALKSLDLRENDRLAFLSLTLADLRDSGAQAGETGGLTDFTQSLRSVSVSALLTEVPAEQRAGYGGGTSGPMVKISMRSKTEPGGVDVNRIAAELGGGGHVRAAGARAPMTIEQAKDVITRLVRAQLSGDAS